MIRALSSACNWIDTQSPEKLESNAPKLLIIYKEEMGLTNVEATLLKEWIKIFEQHHDRDFNIQQLKGIYNLISNPERKIRLEGGKGKLTLFDEYLSIKDIVESILGLVKNKGNRPDNNKSNLPKFRTVFTNKRHNPNAETERLAIDFQDLQKIRISFAKREKTKFNTKKLANTSPSKGRIVSYSSEHFGSNRIQIIPTILNAIQNGHYSLPQRKLKVMPQDYQFPQYEQIAPFNIMLVLDISKSIAWVIPHVEKFISYIILNATNSRDKIGLITFSNGVAQTYHYPTFNVRQVIGTINKLDVKGRTPLGEGLNLALRVFSNDRYKRPGTKNLIILISDCFPEPIEGGHKDLLDEPSYKLVLSAVEHIKQSRIGLIIINPASPKETYKHNWGLYKHNWGLILGKRCAEIAGGKYIEVHSKRKYNLFSGEERIDIDEKTFSEFFTAINEIKKWECSNNWV